MRVLFKCTPIGPGLLYDLATATSADMFQKTRELPSHQECWAQGVTNLHHYPNYTSCFRLSKGQAPSPQEYTEAISPGSYAWQVVSLFYFCVCLTNSNAVKSKQKTPSISFDDDNRSLFYCGME